MFIVLWDFDQSLWNKQEHQNRTIIKDKCLCSLCIAHLMCRIWEDLSAQIKYNVRNDDYISVLSTETSNCCVLITLHEPLMTVSQ